MVHYFCFCFLFSSLQIQRRAGGSSNVGAIALSVTAAAQMLLEAATEAQKEVRLTLVD